MPGLRVRASLGLARGRVKASPAAKRVARELGLSEDDLARCRGTGPRR